MRSFLDWVTQATWVDVLVVVGICACIFMVLGQIIATRARINAGKIEIIEGLAIERVTIDGHLYYKTFRGALTHSASCTNH